MHKWIKRNHLDRPTVHDEHNAMNETTDSENCYNNNRLTKQRYRSGTRLNIPRRPSCPGKFLQSTLLKLSKYLERQSGHKGIHGSVVYQSGL
jgi:hypothetical protein